MRINIEQANKQMLAVLVYRIAIVPFLLKCCFEAGSIIPCEKTLLVCHMIERKIRPMKI